MKPLNEIKKDIANILKRYEVSVGCSFTGTDLPSELTDYITKSNREAKLKEAGFVSVENAVDVGEIVNEFYSMSPKYRTKDRLKKIIKEYISKPKETLTATEVLLLDKQMQMTRKQHDIIVVREAYQECIDIAEDGNYVMLLKNDIDSIMTLEEAKIVRNQARKEVADRIRNRLSQLNKGAKQ